jgi:hypothetical protein
MTLREEARRLAEDLKYKGPTHPYITVEEIESALLAFAKLVLEREPSKEMVIAGCEAMTGNWGAYDVYRAMTAELLRGTGGEMTALERLREDLVKMVESEIHDLPQYEATISTAPGAGVEDTYVTGSYPKLLAVDLPRMVDRFLSWPLPFSVCADLCATRQEHGRTGTTLLTAMEAQQMLKHVLALDAARAQGDPL